MKKIISLRVDVVLFGLIVLFALYFYAGFYHLEDRIMFGWCNATAESIEELYECPAPYLQENAAK